MRQVCYELNVPVTADVIDAIFAKVDATGAGKIDFPTFAKFFDWRAQDVNGLPRHCIVVFQPLQTWRRPATLPARVTPSPRHYQAHIWSSLLHPATRPFQLLTLCKPWPDSVLVFVVLKLT